MSDRNDDHVAAGAENTNAFGGGVDDIESVAAELAALSVRTAASPQRSSQGRHRRTPSTAARPRRPWPGPPKQSVFTFLFRGPKLYAVRNRAGELGAPGGKRDDDDKSIWAAAKREFREETGGPIPRGTYAFFEWGTAHHSIHIYYRHLTEAEAKDLPLGTPGDPDGEEVETLWASWDADGPAPARAQFRPHIAQALSIYEAMAASAQRWPDQPF